MSLPKRYHPETMEPELQDFWESQGVYRFSLESSRPVYSIDTPPATVSGHLHMGHTYSYSHPDFLARFWRMNGYNVFYPMGYDDNGLPTGRYVEKQTGRTAEQVGLQEFIAQCKTIGAQAEEEYESLWRRLALSVDWRYTYRTIEDRSMRISQRSFLDLYQKGLAYRQNAPTIWCPECGTAIAQAELNDLERETTFHTLAFRLQDGSSLPIATTRPELLPACVAVFVHPQDGRYRHLAGGKVTVPLFGQMVQVLLDEGADPEKGTGAVMCCTFGDVADVEWWRSHDLPLVEAIAPDGRMTGAAERWAGLRVHQARQEIVRALQEGGLLLGQQHLPQSVRVHERCDTPAEYIMAQQWFVRVLDFKQELIQAGRQLKWHPPHMEARYCQWVENLGWDWCISRQRPFGVPFPLWYCSECGEILLADVQQLPVDPRWQPPTSPCRCGSTALVPETHVMDTWATSALTPQIVGRWHPDGGLPGDPELYAKVFPMSLRPQAHDIIRTWAFYTILKSLHHFQTLPWRDVAISGWGIAGEGMGKISKSRGGGPIAPLDAIERYSADAIRYWAASTGFGKDAVISENKIQTGAKLVTKLWNVARFSERFVHEHGLSTQGENGDSVPVDLSPADRWILSRTQRMVRQVSALFQGYEYAAAKNEVEVFIWGALADNYLEMAKLRLYDPANATHPAACYTLYHVLLATLKLLAPFLPHVTEAIYRPVFAPYENALSIHISRWPVPDPSLENGQDETTGEILVNIATAVRRYKSEAKLPLGTELARMQLVPADAALAQVLRKATDDLQSITRVQRIEICESAAPGLLKLEADGQVAVALER